MVKKMKLLRLALCLALALALGGGAALAELEEPVSDAVEAPVEEVELSLDEAVSAPALDETPAEGQPESGEAPAGEPPAAEPAAEEAAAPDVPAALEALQAPASIVIGVGEKVQLPVSLQPENAEAALSYTTGKKKYATVSADGVVTGKKAGSATITVKADNGVTAKVKVTVKKAPSKVKLSAARSTLGVGESIACSVSYNSKAGGGYTLTSGDEGILRVDPDNVVTAVSPGSVKLTARSYNGKAASATVTVLAAPEVLGLSQAEATLGVGGTLTLSGVLPEGSAGAISFESLDAAIVQADAASGKLTGVAVGDAEVVARAYNGVEARCFVHVLPAPTGLTLPVKSVTIGVGEEIWLPATLQPEGSAATLKYSTSKKKVATVTADGVVKGKKTGSATITVKTHNGKTAKVSVSVKKAPSKVTLKAGRSQLTVGETTQVTYSLPKKTASGCAFSADDTGVISVDETGKVTALAVGTAKVYVRTYNGKSASVQITVREAPQPVDPSTLEGLFEITYMNIGRNDGILIQCGGEYAYIDSGMRAEGLVAVEYMQAQGVPRLKYYIGTHAHRDHVGGAPAILAAFDVGEVLVPHGKVTSQIKKFAETAAEKQAVKNAAYKTVKVGDSFALGGATFVCLGPIKIRSVDPGKTDENHNSLVLKCTFGQNTFLLTGDATGTEIQEIEKANPGCMQAQVFKNPHHNGTQEYAAKVCAPQITVFSTSNSAQPSASYLSYLQKLGSAVYITSGNRNGHVKIVSDGVNLSVSTQY